jgi:hypothetical protein
VEVVAMMKRTSRMGWRWTAAVAISAMVAAPATADEGETWSAGGKGAATALVNVLYIPAKLVYATTGGIVGGLAYAVTAGDREVAQTIWEPSVGGSYIMTTDQLFPPAEGGVAESGSPPERFAESEPQWPE